MPKLSLIRETPIFTRLIYTRIIHVKMSMFSVLSVFLLVLFICFPCVNESPELVFNEQETFIVEKTDVSTSANVFHQWEAANREQGGENSFVSIDYEKCIPIAQCKFDDCDIEGSRDGKGNFCLPVGYSDIGDWAPDISINIFGVSLLDNPAVYTSPVEHTQASARLPDKDNNAYFMFTNSQNNYGFIWVVEVKGIDSNYPEHISPSMPANVVWWQKLNKCNTIEQCKDPKNPGNFNHPARISHVDGVAAIAFQNWSFTIQGELSLSRISDKFGNVSIPVPKRLQTSTLPRYPEIRSADAVAFYDVSNPREPKFVRKLIGDDKEIWGDQVPGRDISEVSIAKAGDYYHMNVSGTKYNYDGKGSNKRFYSNYRMTSLLSDLNISPMVGEVNANMFTNLNREDAPHPVMVLLNTVPNFIKDKYSLTLQLITSTLKYNNHPEELISEETDRVHLGAEQIFSTEYNLADVANGGVRSNMENNHVLGDLIWMSQACKRAWGFQMMDNGGYNVICHDINPKGSSLSSVGRFLVRGVSAISNQFIHTNNINTNDKFSSLSKNPTS